MTFSEDDPTTPLSAPFSYADVPVELSGQLRSAASRIQDLQRLSIDSIAEVGRLLSTAKSQLDHGLFTSWVVNELQINERTARNYMRVYESFGTKTEIVSVLPIAMVYQLASPSMSEPTRREAVRILQQRTPSAVEQVTKLIGANRGQKSIGFRTPPTNTATAAQSEPTEEEEDEKQTRDTNEFLAAKVIYRHVRSDLEPLLQCLRLARYSGLAEAIEHCRFLEQRSNTRGAGSSRRNDKE